MATPPLPPVSKGVGFSDHLIVLGSSSPAASCAPTTLPKGRVFVKRGQIANRQLMNDAAQSAHTALPPTQLTVQSSPPPPPPPPLRPATETRIPPEEVVLRPPDRRRARFFADGSQPAADNLSSASASPVAAREREQSSDSDSENGTLQSARVSSVHVLDLDDHQLARCTRLNTKLNSLPSGGAFSFMNSSEDVDTASVASSSSSSSSSSSEDFHESRKLIRVDGSAKLSTASGVLDSSTDDEADDHAFSIDGAESVDEEEAVQVRSFGRTLAQMSLQPQSQDIVTEVNSSLAPIPVACNTTPDRARRKQSSGSKAYTMPVSRPCSSNTLQEHILNGCEGRGGGSKRRSRLRVTFFRRGSAKNVGRAAVADDERFVDDEDVIEQRMGSFSTISCFSTRRSSTRLRAMRSDRTEEGGSSSNCGEAQRKGGAQMVAVPEFEGRRMVKNISLQRDDFIDFTTNGRSTSVKRSPWLTRFKSGAEDGSVSGSELGELHGTASSQRRVKRLLRVFGRK